MQYPHYLPGDFSCHSRLYTVPVEEMTCLQDSLHFQGWTYFIFMENEMLIGCIGENSEDMTSTDPTLMPNRIKVVLYVEYVYVGRI